jgi:hypothetical protein
LRDRYPDRYAGYGYAYPDAHAHADANPNSNPDADAHADPDADAHADPDADAHADPDADANTNADAHADPDADANTDAHADPDADADTNANPDCVTYPNGGAGFDHGLQADQPLRFIRDVHNPLNWAGHRPDDPVGRPEPHVWPNPARHLHAVGRPAAGMGVAGVWM